MELDLIKAIVTIQLPHLTTKTTYNISFLIEDRLKMYLEIWELLLKKIMIKN